MKIKRFFAPDIRQAMRLVREEQGPDAVILSNRRVDGGVEIVAAVDYDERLLAEQARAVPAITAAAVSGPAGAASAMHAAPAPAVAGPAASAYTSAPAPRYQSAPPHEPAAGYESAPRHGSPQQREPARQHELAARDEPAARNEPAQPREAAPRYEASPRREPAPQPAANVWSQEPTLVEMKGELHTLRRMLEGQLSSLAWGSFARGEPRRVELIQRLMRLGMSAAQSRAISDRVTTDDADVEILWRRALDVVARGLPLYGRDILAEGGIVALVGPTGAGKTTTAAKLAARYALRHGKRHVALVTIDNYRVGAHEQLRTYGRILDVPVRSADSRAELRSVLDDLSDRSLVLIDTSGMSQRDSGLARQAEILDKDDLRKQVLLLLPATSRQSGLDDVAAAFAAFAPDACVATKIDETTCLGGVLSAAVTHQLPLAYASDGQRVPEDLHPACAEDLVARAAHIMKRTGPRIDEDLVTLSYGREIANAHL